MPKQTKDDEDFEAVERPEARKGARKPSRQAPPAPLPVAEEIEPEVPKRTFHPRLVQAAEDLGLSEADIQGCESTADLQFLIRLAQQDARRVRDAQMGRTGAERDGPHTPGGTAPAPVSPPRGVSPAEPPAEEDVWNFENDLSWTHESVRKELARMGKAILKASKGESSKKELEEMKKELAETKQLLQALQSNTDPRVTRAQSILGQYPHLFGQLDNEPEKSPRRKNYNKLIAYITGPMEAAGERTGLPEKDIPAAMAVLFPKETRSEEDTVLEELPSQPVRRPQPKPVDRVEDWNGATQAVPTSRNGNLRDTGRGDDKAAKKAIALELRKQGVQVSDADYDDDLEDF